MILFLSGIGVTIGLILMLGAGYMLGQRKKPSKPLTKEEQIELDKQRNKEKKLRQEFDNLMSYNLEKAMERKTTD